MSMNTMQDRLPQLVEDVNNLLEPLTHQPADEFDLTVRMVAAIVLETIKQRHGHDYLLGFCEGAIADDNPSNPQLVLKSSVH